MLGCVVTDAPVPPTSAPVDDQCGSCRRCLDGCPTGAITAPGVVDARRCLSWLLQAEGSFPLEHRAALGDRIYGCDECQEVCPPNRRAPEREATGAETNVGRPRRPARPRRRRRARDGRTLVHPEARGPLRAPQRARRARATSAIRPIPPSPTSSSATWRTTIRCCAATPSGRRGGSDARICSRPSSWRPIGRSSPSASAPLR